MDGKWHMAASPQSPNREEEVGGGGRKNRRKQRKTNQKQVQRERNEGGRWRV